MNSPERGIQEIKAAIQNWKEIKARLGLSFFYMLLGEAYLGGGQWDEGLRILEEAETAMADTQERTYLPALYWLKGHFLYQSSEDREQAKYWLQESIRIAQDQQAYLFSIRAALDLSKILHQEGQTGQALDLVQSIYSNDNHAPDQVEARRLISRFQKISST